MQHINYIKKFSCYCNIIFFAAIALISLKYGVAELQQKGYGITYQVTSSMPKGLYLITPAKNLSRGDIVLFKPPNKVLSFLVKHKWLPHSGLMMKYVIATPHDYVCQKQGWIFINHKKIAPVYKEYAIGKKLANTHFCSKLTTQQYLLMSTRNKHSFDGRYFGPVNKNRIIGKANAASI